MIVGGEGGVCVCVGVVDVVPCRLSTPFKCSNVLGAFRVYIHECVNNISRRRGKLIELYNTKKT